MAQGFNRYDQYAVNRISERIELWTYRMYGSNVFELRLLNVDLDGVETRRPTGPKAKDAPDRPAEVHDLPHHQKAMSPETNELFLRFREKVLAFGSDVDERYLNQIPDLA